MLALLNILLLMAPISHNSHELGLGYSLGYNYESVESDNILFDDYFYKGSAEGIGNLNGINVYYNYYLSDQLFIGIESNYLLFNSTLIKTESELINIDGKKVEGEFEHLFEYNTDNLLSVLNIGYNVTSNLYFTLGVAYNTSISDYSISTLERISKPEDAGIFINEQSRIRDEKDTTISNITSTFGLLPTLNIKLPMNSDNSLFLNGSVKYNYSFNNIIDNDLIWNTNSLLFNLGVSYVVGNKYDSKIINSVPIESNIIAFELIDNVERSATNFQFDVISYENLKTSEKRYANFSNKQKIVIYVQLKNLSDKNVEFKLLSDSELVIDKILNSKLSKITIPKELVETSAKPESLTTLLLNDSLTIGKKEFRIEYNLIHSLSYIYTSELNELTKHINSNKNKVLSIYTDENTIYQYLNSINSSNITLNPFDKLEFNLPNKNQDSFLLVIE